jgi:GcrA cell cycle regulator
MQSIIWEQEHSEALRQHLASGMSYSRAADAINAKFKTAYSRSAAIGRANRMGYAGSARPDDWQKSLTIAKAPRRRMPSECQPFSMPAFSMPAFEAQPVRLRCVEIEPRHLSLIDLASGDCRYPYGGEDDGEAITFCGHPQRTGASYCTPHFHLTRGPDTISERAAGNVSPGLVAA